MIFRTFISALMMLLILPWGAYSAGHASPDQRIANAISQETSTFTDAKGAELTARKSCRTAVLPGSPCGPDPVLPAAMAIPVTAPEPGAKTVMQVFARQGRSLPPPRDPPRII